jgi:hypothetical protein
MLFARKFFEERTILQDKNMQLEQNYAEMEDQVSSISEAWKRDQAIVLTL